MMLQDPSTVSLMHSRKKRPLPKLPQRTPSGQFISLGPCWVSSSHHLPPPSYPPISRSSSWYGDVSSTVCEPISTDRIMYRNESLKMETNLPSSNYHGIHQKPYEPSETSHQDDLIEDMDDRSNCTSPIHTPEDTQPHDPAFLTRYGSPLYQLSHRHSMLLSPTSSIHSHSFVPSSSSPQATTTSLEKKQTRRSVSTIDLNASASSTIPSPWQETPVYTQTPNQIDNDDTPTTDRPVTSTRFTIASFSLTHDKDALATYRRMATKTKDQQVQMSYMTYLIQVADLYRHQKRGDLRLRLLHEAGYWLRRLAKSRYPPALVIKGRWYMQQHATYTQAPYLVSLDDLNLMMLDTTKDEHKQQWDKAKRCFQQAAKAGSMEAHFELAMLLCQKQSAVATIMTSLRLAAEHQHLLACYKLAKIFLFGQFDQVPNVQQGLVYLEKVAESTSEHPIHGKASFMLSCIYAGDLTSLRVNPPIEKKNIAGLVKLKNLTQARHYLDKAVALHDPQALFRLGQLYEHGHVELGYSVDPWQAFQWYLEAASETHQPQAMLALAQWYTQGIPGYLVSNPALAFKWCQRASEQCLDQADYLLGTYYETGYGVTPDYPKALACYDKAASKGYTPAAEMLNRQPACHDPPRVVLSHKTAELGNCTIM